MATRITTILKQMIADDQMKVDEIQIIPDSEKHLLLEKFQTKPIPFDRQLCVQDLFAKEVEVHPEQFALVFKEKKFTYQELDDMSNSLAHYLRKNGVKRNSVVAIISKRSYHIIVSILAILKAGGAYMCIDPTYPKERIDEMLNIADCKIALSYHYQEHLHIDTIDLEYFDFYSNIQLISNINQAEDICYIIFTSGSTGKPKGIAMCHRNVINYDLTMRPLMNEKGNSIVSTTNTIFDMFVTESLMPLINGTTIYLADEEEANFQAELSKLVENNQIDIFQTTPTKLRGLIRDHHHLQYLKYFKLIILGGEEFTKDLAEELMQHTDASLYNVYGPAEATVWTTKKEVRQVNDMNIGTPLPNVQIYILDPNHQLLPLGVAGELCISGDGVGKGYLDRSDLTAQKFIPNPYLNEIMYCSGDLCKWNINGEIEILGRMDTQVKIRGLRIELGEIESIMSRFEGIRLSVVCDQKDDTGRQYLVGYYSTDTIIDEGELRTFLGKQLPQYMIPQYFVALQTVPLTSSGKIDRKSLPIPNLNIHHSNYIAPSKEEEKILCAILEKLFKIDKIGILDNFFDLGGDSLRAIEFVTFAHQEGIDIQLQNIFDYPTVKQLIDTIEMENKPKVQYRANEFEKYNSLFKQNKISDDFTITKRGLGNLLLTGATGFLGSHLLQQFIQLEKGNVYCIIRGGKERLRKRLNDYFGNQYDSLFDSRIFCIDADITDHQLSEYIKEHVDTIIHSAATVKHYGSYSYFEKINVEGTKNVIEIAKKCHAQMIYISTLSISGNGFSQDLNQMESKEIINFDEQSLYINQKINNVYVRSKFEAERAILDEILLGLDAKIIRIGNLCNRSNDYQFQMNYESNAFFNRLKSIIDLGFVPSSLTKVPLEFSPVDLTSKGIIQLVQYANTGCIYHLYNPYIISVEQFIRILNMIGIKISIVSDQDFSNLLKSESDLPYVQSFYHAFQNEIDLDGKIQFENNIQIHSEFTNYLLNQIGFEWNTINEEYIRGYINYFKKLDIF